MNAIEFKDFSCYYKVKKEYVTALSHLDLQIKQGEFCVIVGESGCGKTTLIKSCLGMVDYIDGELLVDGEPAEDIDLKSGKYAYVRQELALYPNLTVYENIAFPLRVMKTPQHEVDKRVKEVLSLIGMELFHNRRPRQLSGGQQQRIAIGRALVKNPAFIFCDEPFSNVDPTLRVGLRKLVKDIHKQYNSTVVFVTHELDEAFALAERIVVLQEGSIVEIGTPNELRISGKSDLIRAYLNKPLIEQPSEE